MPLRAVLEAIAGLRAGEGGLDAVVVGRPVRLDGRPHEQTAFVDDFVNQLRRRIDLPVVVRDERLTSVDAEARLAQRERDWRRRKEKLDAAAAAIILQDYLDALPA
jgi:putative Holliday junction resolvase